MRHSVKRRSVLPFFAAVLILGFARCAALADAYDPPATYYNSATGAGATLKQQLHDIIDNHTALSYDSARSSLQVTDADPNQAGHMLTVYDRTSLNVAAISGSPPGWDPNLWNREHTWPRSRGVGSSGPDDSDLFLLRPSLNATNGGRGNINFGGAYGSGATGKVVTDGTNGSMWYPGNVEAGMIARQEFYGAVRYDGSDGSTNNLELGNGNIPDVTGTPDDPPPQLGDLARLLEWHFAAPPDNFERRRNQVIYDNYQHNRDPFIDHPEYVWSVFANQTNDSQLAIAGATVNADGSSSRNVDLGRVFVGSAVPSLQSFAINKSGQNGTYFSVTTSGAATSSLSGPFNAMRTNQTDSKAITVGLNTSTVTAGLKSGTVTVDNLDITTDGGMGRGANDANDVFNVSLAVLNHPLASYSFNIVKTEETIDFGVVPVGSGPATSGLSFNNFAGNGAPTFAANLDLDSISGIGDTQPFQVGLSPLSGLQQNSHVSFFPTFTPTAVGQFTATYTLHFSDENLPGEQMQTLMLSLVGKAILAGDYNGDLTVDAADYVVWRGLEGQNVTAYSGADGDGNGVVDSLDFDVWRAHFGQSASAVGSSMAAAVPEPGAVLLTSIALSAALLRRRDRRAAACLRAM
jgi:endonuclease I